MEQRIIKSGDWGNCIWGIDDTGFLVIGEGLAASLGGAEGAPWSEFRKIITSVSLEGRVVMPAHSSLKGMFKDCEHLERVSLKGLDTSNVEDMSSMFENCTNLKIVDLSTFTTTATEDFGRMFAGCKSLANLDLCNFNTTRARNMRNMFSKCSKLQNLVFLDQFSITGNGRTDCGNLSIRETGKYKIARVVSVKGGVITYYENRGARNKIEKYTLSDFKYTIEDNTFEHPGEGYKFYGWSDEPDGSGNIYVPGQEIQTLDEDMGLYAVWGTLPKIGRIEPPAEITYGMSIPFVIPEIISENDTSIYGFLEISETGEDGTWEAIERDAVLPVACNGWFMRLCATNKCGTTSSNVVRLRIKKAGVDMSKVRWAESNNMVYDGETKEVWLEGLPEGVSPIFQNNTAVEAGSYSTSVELEYDNNNYDIPVRIKNHEWTIRKARYDMSSVRWDYDEAFEFDGSEKVVTISGVPEGVTATYHNNRAVNAGVMTASVTFSYDEINYEAPENPGLCVWEIKKKNLDIRQVIWSESEDFVFDGYKKSVYIENLPDDVEVLYEGNEEQLAGKYLARATITGNYYANSVLEHEWQIKKARYDMSNVKWVYSEPFTYDGQLHEVLLTGLPNGLAARYQNNLGTDAGDYIAKATFACSDTHNFSTPSDMILTWNIKRVHLDMKEVRWNYSEPFTYDGKTKSVELTGLPKGIYAVVENGEASNAGVYIAHASLRYDKRNFEVEQPTDCQWQINKGRINLDATTWNYSEPFTYNGESKTVKLINVPEGVNVEYENNTAVNTGKYVATAKLTAIDSQNYETPDINGCAWAIKKCVLERDTIEWSDDSEFVFDGTEKSVHITSHIDDHIRVEYTGETEINAGVHEVVANFYPIDKANYEAPDAVRHKWMIKKSDFKLNNITWNYSKAFTYDGSRKSVELVDVPEGLIVHYENNVATDAGDYTAIAFFEVMNPDNYNPIEPAYINWTIQKATYDMSNAVWQDEKVFSYDGKEKSVKIFGLPDGITPTYLNNVADGAGDYNASVILNYDERNYEKPEMEDCKWKVEKSVFDIGNARWNYEEAFVYDGKEKVVEVIGMPNGATVQYDSNAATNAGIYFAAAEVLAADTANYNNTHMPDLSWKIEKGEYDMSRVHWDYDMPFVYDGQEKRVILKGLPEGVTAKYKNNIAVDAGEYCASVTFEIADYHNYNVPKFDNCNWTIDKADFDMSEVTWSYTGPITYSGRMHELVLKGLPKGVKAIYEGNCGTSVGAYQAFAELVLYDGANYNVPHVDGCPWEIVKADFDMSAVRWDYDQAKTYNAREQGVYLENLPNGVLATYVNNTATDAGKYTAVASLRVTDVANYNTPSVPDCDWEIEAAQIEVGDLQWNFVPGQLVYDGEEKKIELVEIPNHLSVSYSGNIGVGAGKYTAVAGFEVDSPNYKTPDHIYFDWFIEKAECDMSKARWEYTNSDVYDGETHGIVLKGLPVNVEAIYENNMAVDAGSYDAVARFTTDESNFIVPDDMTCTWVINQASIDTLSVRWDYDSAFVYDGEEKTILLAGVSDLLTVNYKGNTATVAGVYTARAELLPIDPRNYKVPDAQETTWEIVKADYDMSQVKWSDTREFMYDGQTKSVAITGYPEEITPIYSCDSAVNAGEYTATVSFQYDAYNYNEPVAEECKWIINKNTYDLSRTYWAYEEALVYNGKPQSIKLKYMPIDLTPVYRNNEATDVGDYFAEVSFQYDDINYFKPEIGGCKWKIDYAEVPVDESKLHWEYSEPFVYDGSVKSVALATVAVEKDPVIDEDNTSFFGKLFGKRNEDTVVRPMRLMGVPEGFEAVYEETEKTEAGVYFAKATIRNSTNHNYKDYVVPGCKWEIKKGKVDLTSAKWNYDMSLVYDGEEKSVELVGVPENLLDIKYIDNVATRAGVYEAQAVFELLDEKNYERPKPIRGCVWKIKKAKYDMSGVTWNYNDDFEYNGKEKSVKLIGLPEGVKVAAYSGNKATDAGVYTASATFRCADQDNFETPEIQPLRWKIHRKRINTSDTVWNYNESTLFVYDEKIKEIKLTGVPKDVEVVYVNNSKIDAGTYIAKAKLTYDTKNYVADDIQDCIWTINKADIDTSGVHWSYDEPFEYNGKVKKVVLKDVPNKIEVRYMDNKATEIGSYTAKAYLTYNTDNYNEPKIDKTVEWEIVRK